MEKRENPAPPCDVRFGSVGISARKRGYPATAEVSCGEWKAMLEAGAGSGVAGFEAGDLSVRLDRRFACPAEGPEELRAYAEALAECRRRAVPAAGTASGAAVPEPGAAPGAAGRGGPAALLLEFPPSFDYRPETRRHLDRVLKDLAGLPLAVAFFNADWYSSRVIEGLKMRGVCLCLMDIPRGPSSPPSIDVVTAPLVYVKFYGRKADAYCSPDDYEYSDGELLAWLPRLRVLAAQAERLLIVFSSMREGPGWKNADRLAGMWGERARVEQDCGILPANPVGRA